MKKYILIGTILLSMFLFVACGEEKPLADRVIESLADCMGAREVTEEEYEELKDKHALYLTDFMRFLQQENVYLNYKEEDLSIANADLSFYAGEEIVVNDVLIYKYSNDVDDKITYMTVFLYEFASNEDADKFTHYMKEVWENYYTGVKEDKTSQKLCPKDRKMGKVEGEKYLYQIIDFKEDQTGINAVYCFWDSNQVMEVHYYGHEDNEIYPKYQKFLKKMKFEGLKDIELEYAEPQS